MLSDFSQRYDLLRGMIGNNCERINMSLILFKILLLTMVNVVILT